MSLIQIIIYLFILLVVGKTVRKLKTKEVSWIMFFFWLVLWIGVGIITYNVNIISWLANHVGVGRGADLVIYLALLATFYLLFRIFVQLEKMNKRLSDFVREQAKKDFNKKR